MKFLTNYKIFKFFNFIPLLITLIVFPEINHSDTYQKKINNFNKINQYGFKCDYTDENVKTENAFFIWLDKNKYYVTGLENKKVTRFVSNLYNFDDNILNLQYFWGSRNLLINIEDLKFGEFKKGFCKKYFSYKIFINDIISCKENTCNHN